MTLEIAAKIILKGNYSNIITWRLAIEKLKPFTSESVSYSQAAQNILKNVEKILDKPL